MPKRYKDENLMRLIGEYLDVYLPHTRNASPNTVRAYRKAIELFGEYLTETGGAEGDESVRKRGWRACDMTCFSTRNVLGYLDWLRDERGNSVGTRELRLTAITGLVDFATHLDISNASILVSVSKIKVGGGGNRGRIVGHMTVDAWESVVRQPDVLGKRTEHRNWVFMVVMYETAGRNQEIIDLRVRDMLLDSPEGPKAFIKGKGERQRLLPLRDSCAAIVRDYIERFHPGKGKSEDPLFYVRHNGMKSPMSPDCSEKFLKKYGEAARRENPAVPKRVHPHLIRHTRAVHLLEGGMSIEDLSAFLGHQDVATTKVYIQSSAEAKRIHLAKAQGKDPALFSKPGFWKDDDRVLGFLENPE